MSHSGSSLAAGSKDSLTITIRLSPLEVQPALSNLLARSTNCQNGTNPPVLGRLRSIRPLTQGSHRTRWVPSKTSRLALAATCPFSEILVTAVRTESFQSQSACVVPSETFPLMASKEYQKSPEHDWITGALS